MIFDRGFDETYVCMRFSVRGEDCVAIKAYPYDWQIFAYKEAPHGLKYGQIALQRQRTTARRLFLSRSTVLFWVVFFEDLPKNQRNFSIKFVYRPALGDTYV